MKVTVIPVVLVALRSVTEGFIQGLEDLEKRGHVETIQTTALLRLTRILRVLEIYGDCHSEANEKPSAKAGKKKTLKREK